MVSKREEEKVPHVGELSSAPSFLEAAHVFDVTVSRTVRFLGQQAEDDTGTEDSDTPDKIIEHEERVLISSVFFEYSRVSEAQEDRSSLMFDYPVVTRTKTESGVMLTAVGRIYRRTTMDTGY